MLDDILLLLAGLTGLGALISAIVNILKVVGVVKDGTSDKWYQILNLIAFIAVAVIYFLNVPIDWANIDEWMHLLTAVFGFVLQILGGEVAYKTFKGKMPLVGYSFSEHKKV